MSTIVEIKDAVDALNRKLATVSNKLDVIAGLVTSLEVNNLSQAQIDELKSAVDTANASVDAISAKEDAVR